MFETMQTVLTAYFTVAASETVATLRLAGDNAPDVNLNIIHEFSPFHRQLLSVDPSSKEASKGYAVTMNFRGDDASLPFEVSDKDIIIVLARKYGSVIGSQIYEIDLTLPCGYLLTPRGGFNILCDQEHLTAKEEDRQTEYLTILGPVSVS